jgi:hypothetical protein
MNSTFSFLIVLLVLNFVATQNYCPVAPDPSTFDGKHCDPATRMMKPTPDCKFVVGVWRHLNPLSIPNDPPINSHAGFAYVVDEDVEQKILYVSHVTGYFCAKCITFGHGVVCDDNESLKRGEYMLMTPQRLDCNRLYGSQLSVQNLYDTCVNPQAPIYTLLKHNCWFYVKDVCNAYGTGCADQPGSLLETDNYKIVLMNK